MKEPGDGNAGNLKSRSIAALGWSATDVAGRRALQFVVTLVLARLLTPAEFGLIAMLSLFVAVASLLIDGGFGSALVQRKHITEADKSSVLLFNVAAGAVLALAVSLAAPWIARFYREPVLVPLTRLMAANLLIGSFGGVQIALLTRRLDFRTQCKASLAATVVSGAVAVWMAWKGCGVWSLAAQLVVYNTVSTGLLWALCPWKPTLRFRAGPLVLLFGFGSRMMASGLLNAFFERIQLTVIGKAFSAGDLGQYSRANSAQQVPASVLSTVVNRVTFRVFSQVSGDQRKLRRGVQTALVSLMIPTLPMMLGLAVVARPFVIVVFGPKWLPCVPYLRVLSLAGVLWPIHVINLTVMSAIGRSDLFFRLEVAKKILTGIGILCTFRISVMAMVWAALIVSVACVFLNTQYSKLLIEYGLTRQLVDVAPYAAVSALSSALAWAAGFLFPHVPSLQLFAAVFTGLTTYLGTCYILRLESFRSTLAAVLGMFSSAGRSEPFACAAK